MHILHVHSYSMTWKMYFFQTSIIIRQRYNTYVLPYILMLFLISTNMNDCFSLDGCYSILTYNNFNYTDVCILFNPATLIRIPVSRRFSSPLLALKFLKLRILLRTNLEIIIILRQQDNTYVHRYILMLPNI